MKPNSDPKIDQILSSLDGCQRASAPDFFYTRLKARMEKGLDTQIRRPWVLRPVYAIAAILAIILLNLAIILQGDSSMSDTTASTENESYQSIAAEYQMNDLVIEEVYK